MLTDKQKVFIRHGVETFTMRYSGIFLNSQKGYYPLSPQASEALTPLSASPVVGGDLNADGIAGAVAVTAVAALAGRGIRQENHRKNKIKKRDKTVEKQKSQILFLGEVEPAIAFFGRFLEYLAKRFELGIDDLANHQRGVPRFADYIVYRSLLILENNPEIIARNISASEPTWPEDKRLEYLCNKVLSYIKRSELPWKFRSLRTEIETGRCFSRSNKKTWSPTALLCKSPTFFQGQVYAYVGNHPHEYLPRQTISSSKEVPLENYKEDPNLRCSS